MMRKKKTIAQSQAQVDEVVIKQADDESAWGEPMIVSAYDKELSLRMPVDLMRRISLQARKDGFSHAEDWVVQLLSRTVGADVTGIREEPAIYGKKANASRSKR